MNNKILFFSYWYPNKNNPNFALYVKRHVTAIKQNNDVIVLTLNIIKGPSIYKKNISVFTDENNIETHQIYLESIFNKLLYMLLPLHFFVLKKYIKNSIVQKFNFNIIHSNILFPCAIVGYWLSLKYNCKHIVTEHWSKIDKFFKVSIYKNSGKKTLNKAHAITCVSETLKATIQKHTINKNIFVVPNVVDSSQFYYDTLIQKNKGLTFIAVAHWSAPKNPFYFLEALQHLYLENKIPSFKLVLVGNGEQIEKIKQSNYNFEIEYKGNLNANDLKTELNRSHIFFHGSDYETFSVIMAEALMCGVPSVVSPVGIAKDVITIENGFVTNNTISDWKTKILACTNTSYNYQKISEQIKGKFDSKKVGSLLNTVYKKTNPLS